LKINIIYNIKEKKERVEKKEKTGDFVSEKMLKSAEIQTHIN
jgi:hypothetical protein